MRFFSWLSGLDIARKEKEGTITKDLENIDHIDLKKEAAGMLYCSSQEHWKVNELIESRVRVHGIGCLKMRLEYRTGMSIF